MKSLENLLDIAVACAHKAGAILLDGSGLRHINLQTDHDVKLKADIESEHLIRRALASTNLPVIGEEEGGDAKLIDGDELYWVVDPLDGTFNYLRGLHDCCVSIGLMRGKKPQLGVIYNFNTDITYTGIGTEGLKVNGNKFTPKWADKKEHAVLTTGFPSGRDYSDEALFETIREIKVFHKIRMQGSAAMALAYVATGCCDVYREENIKLWDVAAGLALTQAAGGVYHVDYLKKADNPFALNVWTAGKKEWLPER